MVGEKGLEAIKKDADATAAAVKAGNYTHATDLWSLTEGTVESVSSGVNFYNILKWGQDLADGPSNDCLKQTEQFARKLLGKVLHQFL